MFEPITERDKTVVEKYGFPNMQYKKMTVEQLNTVISMATRIIEEHDEKIKEIEKKYNYNSAEFVLAVKTYANKLVDPLLNETEEKEKIKDAIGRDKIDSWKHCMNECGLFRGERSTLRIILINAQEELKGR